MPDREREPLLRFAVERMLREAVPRDAFAAPPLLAPELLFLADDRLEELEDFARVDDFFAPDVFRLALLFRAPVERPDEALLRAPLLRDDPLDEPELPLAPPSIVHLPDITRCAASATASAMIEPNLVALDTTLVAACEAVSAASRPASRILRRAAGLALIAAAAAASPAASISLLIAALASLSTVSLPEELEDLEEVVFADFAIAVSPSACGNIALVL